MPLLALFDIDGTLLLTHDPIAGEAMIETLSAEFGVSLPRDAVERVDHQGQTTLRIARLVLRDTGVTDGRIDERIDGWCARFSERYLELLAGSGTEEWEGAPGAGPALARLEEAGVALALLTGNPEPIARARVERLGLARFFAHYRGAFGCDAETRPELIALARERAGDWPTADTVAIGDTARDARTAHESGIRSIIVRSPRGFASPRGADAFCDDLDDVARQLLAWAG
jgi:phosphoglycolate phosphatase